MSKFRINTLILIFTLISSSTMAIEHIQIYGTRYAIEDLWDYFRFDYRYSDYLSDYQITPSLAEERACNAASTNKPSYCGAKPQRLNAPRTNGCSVSPDGDFLSSCNRHDICYDKLSVGKSQCDRNFQSDMYSTCDYLHRTSGRNKICKGVANIYYSAVVLSGNSAYYSSQSEAKCAAWWGNKEAFCK